MPSAAKGAVLIMSEKKTSGIKNFFEEFKAFAMRGNVLDMAVGVVVGSAFTAIVNSLVNDIISPIIGLFFNADFSDVVIQIGDVGIGVGAFLNAIINFLIVAFVLFVTIKAIKAAGHMPTHIYNAFTVLNNTAGLLGLEITGIRDKKTKKEWKRGG